MAKKLLKHKVFKHECVDCGWSSWRGIRLNSPECSQCGSTKQPNITEDELVQEMEILDDLNKERYAEVKRINVEILEGKPLEEIEGLGIVEESDPSYSKALSPLYREFKSISRRSKMISDVGRAMTLDVSAALRLSEEGSSRERY